MDPSSETTGVNRPMSDARKILISYLNVPGSDLVALTNALMGRLVYASLDDVQEGTGSGLVKSEQLRAAIEAFVLSGEFPDVYATKEQGETADTALQPAASSDQLTEGVTNLFLTTTERTRIANAILADDIIDGGTF